MAGFEDLIRGTLKKHGDTTPQSRAAIYDSSRQALERMLSQNQSLDLAAQSLQRQRLEKAIADIEASYASGATPSAPSATPAAAAAPPPTATTPAPQPQGEVSAPSPTPTPVAPAPPAPQTPTHPSAPPPSTPPPPPPLPPQAPPLEPQSSQSPPPPQSPPPIPVFAPPESPSAASAADNVGRVEPGVVVPPVPVPPTPVATPAPTSVTASPEVAVPVRSPASSPQVQTPPSPMPPSSPPSSPPPSAGGNNPDSGVAGPDAYSEAVAASERKDRKPYAKLLLWAIIVAGVGVSIWWAINFGPDLLKQQLGGSVPNPGQTIESGQFVPGDESEGWVTAFNPADDSINIDTGGRGTAEVFQNADETFVRLASNAGGNDNNLRVLIPRGVMLPLKGAAATIEVLMKSSAKSKQEFAVYCEFGAMGSCGRKRFTASDRPDVQIFDILLNNVDLPANEDAYLSFNTDMGGEGRGIDIYGIRIRLNQ